MPQFAVSRVSGKDEDEGAFDCVQVVAVGGTCLAWKKSPVQNQNDAIKEMNKQRVNGGLAFTEN